MNFDESAIEANAILREESQKIADKKSTPRPIYYYKMMDDIANGVKFWRYITKVKAECVCPVCKGLWTTTLSNVRSGTSMQCLSCARKGKRT